MVPQIAGHRSCESRTAARGRLSERYFRFPFDLYFKGDATRLTIDSSQPEAAREQIAAAAIRHGGVWLISGKAGVGRTKPAAK